VEDSYQNLKKNIVTSADVSFVQNVTETKIKKAMFFAKIVIGAWRTSLFQVGD
jgi:predicted transposase YbfD/YdcC